MSQGISQTETMFVAGVGFGFEFDGSMEGRDVDEEVQKRHDERKRAEGARKRMLQVIELEDVARSLISDDYYTEEEPSVPRPEINIDHAGLNDKTVRHRFPNTLTGRAAFIVTMFGLTTDEQEFFTAEMQEYDGPVIERPARYFKGLEVFHRVGFFAISQNLGVNWTKTREKQTAERLPYIWASIHEPVFMGHTRITPEEVATIPGVENRRH